MQPVLPASQKIQAKWPIAISVAMFMYCLFLPAYEVAGKTALVVTEGSTAFGIGWLGFLGGMFEWYANPLLLFAWLFSLGNNHSTSAISSAASLALALSFLSRDKMALDTAPNFGAIVSLGTGYWMWVASIAIMFLTSSYYLMIQGRTR